MCGFAVGISQKSDIRFEEIVKMNKVIIHRGPDSEQYVSIRGNEIEKINDIIYEKSINEKFNLVFGFRRLSILDLSNRSNQPFVYKNRYVIVFNGEIYNYIELRTELEKKNYSFSSTGDIEVLAASIDCWNLDAFNKWNGMWSVVIYDNHKKQIIATRDRFGIKPLYYTILGEKIYFASEIKQFLQNESIKTSPNLKRIEKNYNTDTECYGFETDFKNIFRFPNSSYCVIDLSSKLKLNFVKYYELPVVKNNSSEVYSEAKASKYAEEYYNLLEQSVELRLNAHVDVGVCLSGGMDSTSITYVIHNILKMKGKHQRLKTFSLIFKNQDSKNCDESTLIEELSANLNLQSYYTEPYLQEVISTYDKMIYYMDEIQHSSLMSYLFTYKLVNEKNVKVTLDGQGADELQGGYFPYLIHYFSNLSFRNIIKERKAFLNNPEAMSYVRKGVLFYFLKILGFKSIVLKVLKYKNYKRNPFITANDAMFFDIEHNLQTLLHYGDRGSMMHSVESRFPFLDYRMVEFWINIPECYKFHNGYTKYIARLAFDKKLPDNIVWSKKKLGWEMPQEYWRSNGLQSELKKYPFDELSSDLKKIVKRDYKEAENIGTKKFYRLINILKWQKIFFK